MGGGQLVRTITAHRDTVTSLAFSSCGALLATACTGGRILVWSSLPGHAARLAGAEQAHDLGVTALAARPAPRGVDREGGAVQLATTGWDGQLVVSRLR